jgi:hypothetical protein
MNLLQEIINLVAKLPADALPLVVHLVRTIRQSDDPKAAIDRAATAASARRLVNRKRR